MFGRCAMVNAQRTVLCVRLMASRGLNYLCPGYQRFFRHMRPFVDEVAAEWRRAKFPVATGCHPSPFPMHLH